MFEEYAHVELVRDLADRLPEGTRGAVVMVYGGDPAEYEVELVDGDGETLSVLTLPEGDLRRVTD